MLDTKRITEIAVLIAVAATLEAISTFIPFLKWPYGGTVSLGMLPIFIIAFKYGLKDGLVAGFVFGFINFAFGGFILHWGSIFFDYIFAYTLIGFAGIYKGIAFTDNRAFVKGILLGGFLRYVMHGISGVLFYSIYAGNEGAIIYSFVFYNLPYMALSIALCITIGLIIKERLMSYF